MGIGSIAAYRKDHYLTEIFNKTGVAKANSSERIILQETIDRVIKERVNGYELPNHTEWQKKLLQQYLPTSCRYE